MNKEVKYLILSELPINLNFVNLISQTYFDRVDYFQDINSCIEFIEDNQFKLMNIKLQPINTVYNTLEISNCLATNKVEEIYLIGEKSSELYFDNIKRNLPPSKLNEIIIVGSQEIGFTEKSRQIYTNILSINPREEFEDYRIRYYKHLLPKITT